MKSTNTAKSAGAGKRDLFAELKEGFDALAAARQGKRTLRTHAVESKLPRNLPDDVTGAMNRACERAQKKPDAFSGAAGRRVLDRTKW